MGNCLPFLWGIGYTATFVVPVHPIPHGMCKQIPMSHIFSLYFQSFKIVRFRPLHSHGRCQQSVSLPSRIHQARTMPPIPDLPPGILYARTVPAHATLPSISADLPSVSSMSDARTVPAIRKSSVRVRPSFFPAGFFLVSIFLQRPFTSVGIGLIVAVQHLSDGSVRTGLVVVV